MTGTKVMAAMLALAAFGAMADAAPDIGLPNLDYTYNGDAMGMSLGEVRIALKPEGAAGCYRYTNTSNPSGLVKMLYGSANQTSLFCLKAEIFCRLSGIPYKAVPTVPFKSPRVKLPFILDDGKMIPDSSHIIGHLKAKMAIDIDAGVTAGSGRTEVETKSSCMRMRMKRGIGKNTSAERKRLA